MNEMTLPSRQDSKFEPVRSEAESQRPNTILSFLGVSGEEFFYFFQTGTGTEPQTLA